MINELLFMVVILLSNIIQGITGFAGTILAMPFSLKLVGMDVAVPVLNMLGVLSGIYVLFGNYRYVNLKELLKILLIMGPSLGVGLLIKQALQKDAGVLYLLLGVIVLFISIKGLLGLYLEYLGRKSFINPNNATLNLILVLSGIVHGMYVCGGPFLIAYLAKRIDKKIEFRATISTVWIFLNGIIFVSQLLNGMWNSNSIRIQLYSIPPLIVGMFIGSILSKKMSQKFFMVLTYILLLIAGISLFFK
ncbi:MAG: sulfite exporter TauE/SafE family protein [Lachnospiraceae bacterium]|nr:sulfite exporter TauE/SafE family protein [Lachnospiraceae bacterium]